MDSARKLFRDIRRVESNTGSRNIAMRRQLNYLLLQGGKKCNDCPKTTCSECDECSECSEDSCCSKDSCCDSSLRTPAATPALRTPAVRAALILS